MTGSHGFPRRRSSLACGLFAACVVLVAAGVAPAQEEPATQGEERPNSRLELPRSQLNQPYEGPVLVSIYTAIGGGFEVDQSKTEPGIGGVLVFRPGAAANFLDFLYDWNTGMVLQIDYQQLSDTDEVLAADGILRRYFSDRGRDGTEVRLFLGAGIGGARFSIPRTGGEEVDKYWCAVAEAGQEWLTRDQWFFFVKAQYRYHLHRHRNYRAISLQAGVGAPWPW